VPTHTLLLQANVIGERVWMYDGGLLSVTTERGHVSLENVVMYGHYGSIVVETHKAPIVITLNARYFNGAFNLQSEKGLVYVDPGTVQRSAVQCAGTLSRTPCIVYSH
jgi:hypothetical protein